MIVLPDFIENLPVPERLLALARDGVWPTPETARMQNLRPLVSKERIRSILPEHDNVSPEHDRIYLYPVASMRTVASEIHSNRFWHDHGALCEIDPARSLIIGDFGTGSDAPIIAVYADTHAQPAVWGLSWLVDAARNISTRWSQLASTFDAFVDALGLTTAPSHGRG